MYFVLILEFQLCVRSQDRLGQNAVDGETLWPVELQADGLPSAPKGRNGSGLSYILPENLNLLCVGEFVCVENLLMKKIQGSSTTRNAED